MIMHLKLMLDDSSKQTLHFFFIYDVTFVSRYRQNRAFVLPDRSTLQGLDQAHATALSHELAYLSFA